VLLVPEGKVAAHQADSRLIDRLGDYVVRRRTSVFVGSVVIFGVLATFASKNEFNDVWLKYFDETFAVRNATEFMISELTGHHRIQFAISSGEANGIMDSDYMNDVDRFVDWLRSQPNVKFVSSYTDTIKRLNRDMNGDDESYYRIPDNPELISQYSLMYQLSLPFGLGLENQIDINNSATRVDVLLGAVSSNEIIDFERRAAAWTTEHLPEPMHTRGVGFDLLLGELSHQNGIGMLTGTILALLSVSVLLIWALKSLKYGMLSMLPNLLPALVSFGIWGLIDGQIGISVSIVACMTLGIVIDNTVHFISKYTHARFTTGLSTIEATRYAFRTVGLALTATALVISVNFGIMATSHYYPNASMGLLTSITVVVALLVTFFFFVPLLLFIDKERQRSAEPAESLALKI